MAKTENPKDWKFYTNIGLLVSGITGGLAVNNSSSERILKLEINSQHQLEIIKELREEVKSLKEGMKAKGIVDRVADVAPIVEGNFVFKK